MPRYASFCTRCGTALSGESAFCTSCGSPIAAVPEPSPVQTAVPPLVPPSSPTPVGPGRGRLRTTALIAGAVALLLGAGVGIGYIVHRAGDDGDPIAASAEQSTPDAVAGRTGEGSPGAAEGFGNDPDDPLALGYPYEDQQCEGQYVVVLASSGDPAVYQSTLRPAMDQFGSDDLPARYLRTDSSCNAFNQVGPDGHPIYAAYLGPFDDGATACTTRMERTTTSTYVKKLSDSFDGAFYCLCAFSPSDLPDLNNRTDEVSSGDRRFWMVELQHMMFNTGHNPDQLFGGNFGSRTTEMVTAYQEEQGLPGTGALDQSTWAALQASTC